MIFSAVVAAMVTQAGRTSDRKASWPFAAVARMAGDATVLAVIVLFFLLPNRKGYRASIAQADDERFLRGNRHRQGKRHCRSEPKGGAATAARWHC